MKVFRFKKLLLLIPLYCVSCQGHETIEEKEREVVEPEDSLNPVSADNTITDLPDNVQPLYDFFSAGKSYQSIPTDLLKIMGDTPENAPLDDFYPADYGFLENGYVFIYYTGMGATDLYTFGLYKVAFFDKGGNYINTASVNTTDNSVSIEIVADKMVYLANTYSEYSDDNEEEIPEETGNSIKDISVFVATTSGLTAITELPSGEWPLLRNRIFAFKGYKFKKQSYTDYFSEYDWYKPEITNSDDLPLSQNEKDCADYILSLEDQSD